MTTARTSFARRSFRGIAVAAVTGAAVTLAPATAFADSGDSGGVSVAAAPAAAPNAVAQRAVDVTLAQQGDPYGWGAAGPNAFDCSGLTSFAYRQAGISLPRTSRGQAGVGTPVSKSDLKPGDLVFFYSPISHVGLYIGNGQMVHASTAGQPVKVVNLNSVPGFSAARRVA